MADELPRPTPEGKLIRQVRSLSIPKLSIPAAAARIGLSAEQWGYIERGYYPARGGNPARPFSAPAATVAKMAHALRITPEQLDTEGQRPDAADDLREILRAQSRDGIPDLSATADEAGSLDALVEGVARHFAQDAIVQALLGQPNKAAATRLAEVFELLSFRAERKERKGGGGDGES